MRKLSIIILVLLVSCKDIDDKRTEKKANFVTVQESNNDSNEILLNLLPKQLEQKTISFGVSLLVKDYKIIIKSNCHNFIDKADIDFEYLHKELQFQQLYFIHDNDTLNVIKVPSRLGNFKYKEKTFHYSKNEVKFVSVISNGSDFFYYLSGGELNVQGAPEYYCFYNKEGKLLWEVYLEEKGNYSNALSNYNIEKLMTKDAITTYRTFPLLEIGNKVNSSIIKPVNRPNLKE